MTERPDDRRTLRPQPTRWDVAARRTGRVVFWAAAGLAWVYVIVGDEGLVEQWKRNQERAQIGERLAEECARTEALRARVEALIHDDLTIEREIRTTLDYQRPGETVLIVGDDDPLAQSSRP